jgi:hypothetical protein
MGHFMEAERFGIEELLHRVDGEQYCRRLDNRLLSESSSRRIGPRALTGSLRRKTFSLLEFKPIGLPKQNLRHSRSLWIPSKPDLTHPLESLWPRRKLIGGAVPRFGAAAISEEAHIVHTAGRGPRIRKNSPRS